MMKHKQNFFMVTSALLKIGFAVTDRFEDVIIGNLFTSGEVGDTAGNFHQPGVGARAEFEPGNRFAQ